MYVHPFTFTFTFNAIFNVNSIILCATPTLYAYRLAAAAATGAALSAGVEGSAAENERLGVIAARDQVGFEFCRRRQVDRQT